MTSVPEDFSERQPSGRRYFTVFGGRIGGGPAWATGQVDRVPNTERHREGGPAPAGPDELGSV